MVVLGNNLLTWTFSFPYPLFRLRTSTNLFVCRRKIFYRYLDLNLLKHFPPPFGFPMRIRLWSG